MQDADNPNNMLGFIDSPTYINSFSSSLSFTIQEPTLIRKRPSLRKKDKRSIVNEMAIANKSRQRKNSDLDFIQNKLSGVVHDQIQQQNHLSDSSGYEFDKEDVVSTGSLNRLLMDEDKSSKQAHSADKKPQSAIWIV